MNRSYFWIPTLVGFFLSWWWVDTHHHPQPRGIEIKLASSGNFSTLLPLPTSDLVWLIDDKGQMMSQDGNILWLDQLDQLLRDETTSTTHVSTTHVSTTHVSTTHVSATPMSTTHVSATRVPTKPASAVLAPKRLASRPPVLVELWIDRRCPFEAIAPVLELGAKHAVCMHLCLRPDPSKEFGSCKGEGK